MFMKMDMSISPSSFARGQTSFCFGGAGRLKARLSVPKAPAFLSTADLTAPDLIAGEPNVTEAALVVVNATVAWRDDLAIVARVADGPETRTPVSPLVPLSVRKVGFGLSCPRPPAGETCALELRLQRRSPGAKSDPWETVDTVKTTLRIRQPGQTRKRTFRSTIDGSVQYYAVVPALAATSDARDERPGLVLTLHGAGVEAIGQAEAYAAKPGLHIVAPTNRRPYGFDWEDWGRLDAIEVLELAQKALRNGPAANLPHRPFDGRARHLAPGRDVSRPVRRDRSERRLDQHVVVCRSETRRVGRAGQTS